MKKEMKPREFWIQIKQHEEDWLHGALKTNVYTEEHVRITQDKDLDWHKSMCVLVQEILPQPEPDYKKLAEKLEEVIHDIAYAHGKGKNASVFSFREMCREVLATYRAEIGVKE